MTKSDREHSIERMLRHSLPLDRPASGECPDAETLAAFADDLLSADARNDVEAHLADCQRCQALTAAMVGAAGSSEGISDPVAAVPWWRSRRALTWMAPAAAAATAVALWVAVPSQRAPQLEQDPTEARQAAPSEPASRDALQAPADERRDFRVSGAQPDGQAERLGRTAAAKPTGAAVPESAAPVAASPTSPLGEPLAAPPAQDSLRAAEAPSGAGQNELTRQEGAATEERAPAASALAAAARAGMRASVNEDIVSPDPQIRWRIGPGAAVQYSADGGGTWAPQPTGASVELTGGDAPSATVCWLVGRAGTVLRTTDGGRQWQRIVFPGATDLVAVMASSALSATVDASDGRRFRTIDGGQTWVSLP